jgi:hypothetical protein
LWQEVTQPRLASTRINLRLKKVSSRFENRIFAKRLFRVLYPENCGTRDLAHEKTTKAPEGASAGAGTGAVIGVVLGWLAGIGAIAIPGVGPFIAASPIVAALAGMGAATTQPRPSYKPHPVGPFCL